MSSRKAAPSLKTSLHTSLPGRHTRGGCAFSHFEFCSCSSLTHLHLQELGDVEGEGAQDGRDDVLEGAHQGRRLDEGVAVVHGIADCHVPIWDEEIYSDS